MVLGAHPGGRPAAAARHGAAAHPGRMRQDRRQAHGLGAIQYVHPRRFMQLDAAARARKALLGRAAGIPRGAGRNNGRGGAQGADGHGAGGGAERLC